MENFKSLNQTYQNLTDGMEFKNYKELCEFLQQPVGRGNSKIPQEEMFSRYFEYKKQGRKIIIENVYYEPLPTFGKGAYSMLIQKLILDMLVNEKLSTGNNTLYFSKTQFALKLGLVKDEYKTYSRNKYKLSELLNIDTEIVDEFYRMTNTKMHGYIETALKSLEMKSNIQYQTGLIMIKEHFQYGVREASELEIKKILSFENEAMDEIIKKYPEVKKDSFNRADIMLRNEWGEFTSIVSQKLSENGMGYIDFYFRGIKLVLSENIEYAKDRLEKFISQNRNEIKYELNQLFVENYKNSYNSFHEKAIEQVKDSNGKIKEYVYVRADCNYVRDGHDLIDATVNKKENTIDIIKRRECLEELEYDGIPF